MTTSVLADSDQLVRVVVPKPLLNQTAQLLLSRLGGLLGREIRYLPFERGTPCTEDTVNQYLSVHDELRKSRGVMIALAENTLSFRLSGLQKLADQRLNEAKQMMSVQEWLDTNCRDILDESDVTLSVRKQLIYPSGSQVALSGAPDRWQLTQKILYLLVASLDSFTQHFPRSLNIVERGKGQFPFISILRNDVEIRMIQTIVLWISHGRTSIISGEFTKGNEKVIQLFLLEGLPKKDVIKSVESIFAQRPHLMSRLYTMRGLLAFGILSMTIKKRWNVQYGLHPSRSPMAVPYHAKGVPSERAEWGHPDVAIIFTCLSFYYQGLSLAQFQQSLEHVSKTDDPSNEFNRWTSSAEELPPVLQDWTAIRKEDTKQIAEVWQALRYNILAINYFLNNFVFPKYAKQFEYKMETSAWDIPLLSLSERSEVPQLTTGFSGTNDDKIMMPLTIKQGDLSTLKHTNAEVLTYLLRPKNDKYIVVADHRGRNIDETGFLRLVHRQGIRILIDAGAQILEMDNLTLVRRWLEIDFEAVAALYFHDDKPIIIYRKGDTVPLLASPFADRIENCLVYLDQAHTRGTDLKFTDGAVGALTLGLGQTKDHTVQGLCYISIDLM